MLKQLNKSKAPERPNFRSEATPGQLVVFVCVFLFAALVCFSLGVLVGRVERDQDVVQIAERGDNRETPLPPSPRGLSEPVEQAQEETSKPQEGVQTSPRRVPMPASDTSTAPGYPNSPGTPIPVQPTSSGPRYSELPAPPPRSQQPETQKAAEQEKESVPKQPVASTATPSESSQAADGAVAPGKADGGTPAETPAATQAPAEVASGTVAPSAAGTGNQTASGTGAAANLPEKVEKTPDAAGASAAASGKGGYCIQLASFSGSNRKRLADEYKRRMRSNADVSVDLIPSEDDKYIRVVMGNYPDRETAARVCSDLKKRQGFNESFVRKR